jgi:phospholipid/cholesterol/gamma-HCH transport system substrate-binding protein
MTTRRGLAVAIAALSLCVGLAACSSDGLTVKAIFDDTGDLQERGGVQVADVRVGTISSIRLTKDFKAAVTLRLKPGSKIPKDSRALLRTTSLLGEKFIEIRPNGDPGATPSLVDGDDLGRGEEAPELEFIAQEAVTVLGGVVASDVATLVQTGAEAFGGRGTELRGLITDLATVAQTLSERTGDIGRIIDGIDKATATLATGKAPLQELLTNLANTTQILSDNRQKAIDSLAAISKVALTGDDLLQRYRADMDRQVRQVDVILQKVAASQGEVVALLTWLRKFAEGAPLVTPGDFAQVSMWVLPAALDCRSPGNVVGACTTTQRPAP